MNIAVRETRILAIWREKEWHYDDSEEVTTAVL